ncbi:cytochrome d ubiquinol oxidase subunit II [Galbitalea soli]|uniref:Cytochrome d ubiquinol oxidase subunit II n=1 Tax=Galbitalea soli TaxID=1268042 RepID=A0A7C9PL28_9MICO|nr:cytochrome d ubiquinol oxidase subunit II [Galbitalea soli]NEM89767.1 cytochrome d ubiquinol oxidase subunit II [Galbitalea soli]NYJ30469.1 cytochrome d ubiquinol oxidase subunit II [Galbitalea soli]
MEILPTVWFVVIAVLWTGYLVLEGFDLGVGMHLLVSARTETDRRVMLNSIGPVWDGNEVWLVTAGAATFAAFPFWYASLFSALYLPLVAVLLGLIFRAVAIEYRGKGASDRWRRVWTLALGAGSFVAAFGIGALLALTTTGLPLDANGDRVGGPWAWFSPWAIVGGLAVVGFCLVHSSAFLALKTDGPVRVAARRRTVAWTPLAVIPIVVWVVGVQLRHGSIVTWSLVVLAVAALVWGWVAARASCEGQAFAGIALFLVLGVAAIFGASYPVVLPSTLDPAWSLTVATASSSPYTLGVMSWVAAFGVPLVIAYQAWSYWVFRRRISGAHIPEPHAVLPAVRR